jgi:hypothetical protein
MKDLSFSKYKASSIVAALCQTEDTSQRRSLLSDEVFKHFLVPAVRAPRPTTPHQSARAEPQHRCPWPAKRARCALHRLQPAPVPAAGACSADWRCDV